MWNFSAQFESAFAQSDGQKVPVYKKKKEGVLLLDFMSESMCVRNKCVKGDHILPASVFLPRRS